MVRWRQSHRGLPAGKRPGPHPQRKRSQESENMLTFECEVGALVDAVAKAARIAPTKGPAVYKTGGIQIECDSDGSLRIKAANDDATFLHRMSGETTATEAFFVRFPATLFAKYVSSLPKSSGERVTISTDGGEATISCPPARAVFRVMPEPIARSIEWFDPEGMTESADFGRRVGQVAWAAGRSIGPPFDGIHVSGTEVLATDRVALAAAACVVPLERPVTAPLASLSSILAQAPDVHVRATETRLELMSDEVTQMTAALIAAAYPKVRSAFPPDRWTESFEMSRDYVSDALERLIALGNEDSLDPRAKFEIDGEALSVHLHVEGVGEVSDVLTVEGYEGAPRSFMFDPRRLAVGIRSAGADRVHVGFIGKETFTPWRISDGGAYEAWVMCMGERGQ